MHEAWNEDPWNDDQAASADAAWYNEYWGLEFHAAPAATATSSSAPLGGEALACDEPLSPPQVKTMLPYGVGMQDTGASASAGPEGAVQGLISAVVRVDPGTEIYVNSHAKYRP